MDDLALFLAKINENIVNPILALLFTVALLYFFVGLFKFVQGAESKELRQTGRQHMLWGIIGLFFMTTIYLILQMVLVTFQLDADVPAEVPLNNII